MTAPVPVSPRPSQAVAFKVAELVGGSLKRLIAASLLAIPGLIWFMKEMNVPYSCDEPIHAKHLSFAVALIVAGAIVLQPSFGKQLTGIYVTVFPNGIPLIGGRRSTDLPPVSTTHEDKTNG